MLKAKGFRPLGVTILTDRAHSTQGHHEAAKSMHCEAAAIRYVNGKLTRLKIDTAIREPGKLLTL